MRKKGRVYPAVVRSILLCGYETWPVRVADESIPVQLFKRRRRWFGHAARRPDGELIKDPLLPTPAKGVDNHDQGRPGTLSRHLGFGYVANSIGDADSIRPG